MACTAASHTIDGGLFADPYTKEVCARTLRILIYGLNSAPELTGIGKYTGEMASWLAVRGHDVRVVTAPPYYPAWRVSSGHANAYRTEHPEPNLTIHRCPLYVPAQPTGSRRMRHLISFALSSLPVVLREAALLPDVVLTIEPTFFGAPTALLAAYIAQAPAWLHVQDFEIDAAFDLGLLPAKGLVHTFALALEGLFTRAFDRVSSISENMIRRAVSKGVPESRTVFFPNWVDTDAVHPLPSGISNVFREQLGLQGKTVVLYSGNMGNKQGLEMLAPLASSFAEGPSTADANVHFLFCGDGAFRPQLEALVRDLPNVTLLPLQPVELLNQLLNAADIHLLPQRADAADLVMPSKLTGMLSSGRPVLATASAGTHLADVIVGSDLGIVVPPEDPGALHAAVSELASSASLRRALGENARAYAVRNLGREQVLLRFEHDLGEVVRGTGRREKAPVIGEVESPEHILGETPL